MARAAASFASLMAEVDSDDDKPAPKLEEKAEAKVKEADAAVSEAAAQLKKASVEEKKEEEEEEDNAPKGFYATTGGKKLSKQQKRKLAKEAEEKRRYEEAKKEAENQPDPRAEEDKALAVKLAPLKLTVKEVKPDGHCLYRAVGDQCVQNLSSLPENLSNEVSAWPEGTEYLKLRRKTAEYMRLRRNDFEPFVDADYDSYLQKIEGTAEWGGDIELQALSRALGANIHVHSALLAEQVFSPDAPSSLHFNVSFHRHAFGLGEHYNSLKPAV
eukprot:CAMPEP_0177724084 /NCGR_PEP_ID=MMETSP0484_2-20121128/18543_1 /TAXON_ID=354590 /ORGANISM="Rhodomonas lens, Strain RHODO" /LENGTH=271 /DNA_ID=CAMNT_0019236535 /DNA_START=28 /DNA_END=843 /DNA_ORIENTATION=+